LSHTPHYLHGLNPEQREAVLATEGPVLVLAGAGSGKTRMLVHRLAHLIRGHGVEPRRILAVTFTNRAAAEMRERVARLVGREARGALVSTFHSLGARLLREHGERIGVPAEYSIYGTADQAALVRRILVEEVHVAATAGEDAYDPKRVLYAIGDWKNRLVTPAEAAREVAGEGVRGDRRDDYAVLAADVYPRYEQALRAAGACDFDDLLVLPVTLLRDHLEVRERAWSRWRYLMIDEYQDTNHAQLQMARLLAGAHRNLCVVGDDDQSIYGWRGADLRNILEFERSFPGAKVVLLERNYRSTQRILEAANDVIGHNASRRPKRLRTESGPGPRIDLYELVEEGGKSAEEVEAEMVAREVDLRRFSEKLRFGDFAVLYRTNLQSRPLEEALRARNLPYRVVGGTSFFDRKEVADLAAYLQLMVNPRHEMALRRIVNYPVRGIGRTTLLRMVGAARAARLPLLEAMRRDPPAEGLARAQSAAVRAFADEVDALRGEFVATQAAVSRGEGGERTLAGFARNLVRRVRLEEAIRAENARSERAAEVRVDILRDFVGSLQRWEERTWAARPLPDEEEAWEPPTLRAFLERLSLTEEDDRKEQEDASPDLVTLTTLHSAKGLEFSHVFIVGLEEEILPHARSVDQAGEPGADPVAEERRLFYVGITRARHRLTLSACATRRQRGEPVARQPSRFLREISPDLLDRRSPAAAGSLDEGESRRMKSNFFAEMRSLLAEEKG
jgi:DNA helicase II / ATP-dependent DNA helicase PcrA